jgi:predicted aspartyl protease
VKPVIRTQIKNGKANVDIVETNGRLGTNATIKNYILVKQRKNQTHLTSDSDNESEEEGDAPNTEPEEAMPKISLATITGIAQPQTLKLRGHVKKENVTILVDTGSTHNFMDINVARKLNLFVYPAADIRVMVADGKKIDGVGKCHKVKLQIEDYELETGFYTVPLGGVDVVLGIQWLQMLGTYSANHQKQFIKFKWEGRRYKLYGFHHPPPKLYPHNKWRN